MAIPERDPAEAPLSEDEVSGRPASGELASNSEGGVSKAGREARRPKHAARLRQLVWLVETNGTVGGLLRAGLEASGLDVNMAKEGADVNGPMNRLVADAILANADHPEVEAKRARGRRPFDGDEVPVIHYRARKSPEGWRFLVDPSAATAEPLSVGVFCQHVRARLKPEPVALASDEIQAGALRVDTSGYRVFVADEEVLLTALEFRLLVTLFRAVGRVLSREELLRQAWGIRRPVDTRTVDTHVKRLRRKLRSEGAMIETARSFGYRLAPPDQG